MKLWNKELEANFFERTLEIVDPEVLFYQADANKYFAYWPKGYEGKKSTIQSRNSYIGGYTEKWTRKLLDNIAKDNNGYSITNVFCEEIGLSSKSPADVAICKTNTANQSPENIIVIVETKMSIVWNWELIINNSYKLKCIGDYKTHQGNPGLLRSDTMLKAIGKSINIRVSGFLSSKIPIIVLGNTPINNSYYQKVDFLKANGIIQGFWSINPRPLDDTNDASNIKKTEKNGFYRFDDYEELKDSIKELLTEDKIFFASMQNKRSLGKIIESANLQDSYEKKAEAFLKMLREHT